MVKNDDSGQWWLYSNGWSSIRMLAMPVGFKHQKVLGPAREHSTHLPAIPLRLSCRHWGQWFISENQNLPFLRIQTLFGGATSIRGIGTVIPKVVGSVGIIEAVRLDDTDYSQLPLVLWDGHTLDGIEWVMAQGQSTMGQPQAITWIVGNGRAARSEHSRFTCLIRCQSCRRVRFLVSCLWSMVVLFCQDWCWK